MKYKISGLIKVFCLLAILSYTHSAEGLSMPLMDDATIVDKYRQDINFGDENFLVVDNKSSVGEVSASLIKFDISHIQKYFPKESIISAKLRLYVKELDKKGSMAAFYYYSNRWREEEATWSFERYDGGILNMLPLVEVTKNNDFVMIDVTEHIRTVKRDGRTSYSIFLTPITKTGEELKIDVSFASKESGGNAPRLDVILGPML